MITTHLSMFFEFGAGEVPVPLPAFPSVEVSSPLVATRNRRNITLPDIGTLSLRTDRLTGESESRLRAPVGLSKSYDLVMPSGLPTTGQSLHVNSSGEMGFQGYRQTFDDFRKDSLGANLSAEEMQRVAASSGMTTVVAPRAGLVSSIAIKSSEARTGGTATVELFINGSTAGVTAILDGTNTTINVTETSKAFVAGDALSLKVSSSSWASSSTANIRGILEIET